MIDVKDDTGYLTYRSEVPTAIEIGANTQRRAPDVQKRLQVLREHGIHPIARIVVAKDPLLASRKPAWSVRHVNGGLWRDRLDFAWVDAFNDSVWVYASQLAAEAVRIGFAEVQYDYVRFPDEPESRLALAVFPGRRAGETKRQGVARNLKLLGDRTRPLGVPFTIDVFGLTTSAPTDMGIGQMWEDLVTTADVVLPMVYPSHYFRGYYSLKHPNSEPYKVIRRAMQDAIRRSEPLGKTAEIRPYLQAFTLGPAALHAGPKCGSRSGPRKSWASRDGSCGTRAVRTKSGYFRPKGDGDRSEARDRRQAPPGGDRLTGAAARRSVNDHSN